MGFHGVDVEVCDHEHHARCFVLLIKFVLKILKSLEVELLHER